MTDFTDASEQSSAVPQSRSSGWTPFTQAFFFTEGKTGFYSLHSL